MPNQLSEPPEDTIRDLFLDDWIPSNTADYDPNLAAGDSNLLPIHQGNYDSTLSDPQISITVPGGEDNTNPGIDPGGGGRTWFRMGDPLVQCWAEKGEKYNAEQADDMVRLLRLECERIVHKHSTGAGELFELSPRWEGRFPDPDDVTSPKWQSQLRVTYTWFKNP